MYGHCSPERIAEGMAEPLDKTELAYDVSDEYRPEPAPIPEPPAWQDGSFRIGIHTSIAGDIAGALDIASKLGANALQIFSASPRMWPRGGTRIAEADATRFRARRAELGLGPLVIHDNYLINLASPDRVMRTRSIQAFHDELVRAMSLGADFLVAHPGAGLGSEKSQAISDETRDLPMGVCLDTAHTFEAGYDITTEEGLGRTLDLVERTVGLDRVYVLHANDSKTPLGSRVDRHEHIGRGKIGLEAFRRILNHPRLGPGSQGLAGRAFILETPIDLPGDDRRNVRALWDLVGVDPKQAPEAVDGFSMVRRKKISSRKPQRTQRKKAKGKKVGAKKRKGGSK